MIEWRPVPGFEESHLVSNTGEVKSIVKFRKSTRIRTIKPYLNNYGYYTAAICRNYYHKSHYIHRLVALAFIPNPENKRSVNHKNGIKTDNNLSNLEWATDLENIRHSFATGLADNSFKNKVIHQYTKDRVYVSSYPSLTKAAAAVGANMRNISSCALGIHSSCAGFLWYYNKI